MNYAETLERDRRLKLDRVRALGRDPFGGPPSRVAGSTAQAAVESLQLFEAEAVAGAERPVRLLRGRVVSKNDRGRLKFFFLRDRTGDIQLMASRAAFVEEEWDLVSQVDVLDHVEVEGTLMRTKTGEATLGVESLSFLGKSIAPPPEKHHGVRDEELLVRQRHLALIQDAGLRANLVFRSKVLGALRRVLDGQGYTEVETPVLSQHASGAAARPFVTRHHALGEELCLRVAPELDLKRLLVGGMERVYEIGRVFRNEGVDATHNPEFTLLECYEAYADYARMIEVCNELVWECACGITPPAGSSRLPRASQATFADLMAEQAGVTDVWDEDQVRSQALRCGCLRWDHWATAESLFDLLVVPGLVCPTYVTHHPAGMCPLARRSQGDPRVAERFELYIGGLEVANGYSELTDPDEQQVNFESQAFGRAAERFRESFPDQAVPDGSGPPHLEDAWGSLIGEERAGIDFDYIRALKVGLPMAGGLGIGVDRLVMVLAEAGSLREVLAFPLTRKRAGSPS